MKKIRWAKNSMPKTADKQLAVMSLENVGKARKFHESFPQYSVTPLAQLKGMAEYLGLGSLFVKDESYRFGLNAFKVLGGSFAMARYIAGQLGKDVSEVDYNYLTGDKLKEEFGQATFFTATDGNHGRGVAWAANKLGQKAVVHMPKGSVQSRFDNIAKEGAQVTIEDVNYDDCVRMAAAEAEQTEHGVIVQDTAWEGYEEIPSWIMQGYGTMASEAAEQLRQCGVNRPTHVFVQAGVGSLAGAVVGYFTNLFPNDSAQVRGHGGRGGRLPVPGAPWPGTESPDRGRRSPDHHGGPGLRRAQHHLLGHPAEPRRCLCLLPRLGQRQGHADAGRAREGRPHGDLRRVRRRGHGLLDAIMSDEPIRNCGRPWAGSIQPGAHVLHRGEHRPDEVPPGDLGRGTPPRTPQHMKDLMEHTGGWSIE